jgi:hypothetical protein
MLFAPGAQAQADDSAATAHQLMIRSGLAVQLRGFTDQLADSIRQSAGNLDAGVVTSLVDASKQAFKPDALQQDITARIAKKLTVGDMKAALTWLETDAGGRITRAEELASVSFDMARLSAYAEELKTKPLAAKREKLISELMSASGAARNAAAVAETMALGVALGMDSLQPRERRAGEATLRARVRQAMPPEQMQAFFGQQLPVTFAYTFRDTSDADLAGYVAFLKGVAGKRYQDAINAALLEGLARASVQVGEIAGQRQRQTAL